MKGITVISGDAAATRAFGCSIGRRLTGGEIIFLSGPLGAGKTTMVQGIASGMGITERIQSPSFVLERIHKGRLTLRHLDFYRLGPDDIDDAGFFDEPGDSTVTVVEWAERSSRNPGFTLIAAINPVPGKPDMRNITVETGSTEWGDKIVEAAKESGLAR